MLAHELKVSSDRAKEVLFVELCVHPMNEVQPAVHHTAWNGRPFGSFSVIQIINFESSLDRLRSYLECGIQSNNTHFMSTNNSLANLFH